MSDAKYATATTLAGRRRQVWEGRAEMTGPGGLRRSQLTQNRQGKIVSLAKSRLMGGGLRGGAKSKRRMKRALRKITKSNNKIQLYNVKEDKVKDVRKAACTISWAKIPKQGSRRYFLVKAQGMSRLMSRDDYLMLREEGMCQVKKQGMPPEPTRRSPMWAKRN